MKVWMLPLFIISYSAFSSEFSHIKLNPEFEQYLTRPRLKSNPSIFNNTKASALTSGTETSFQSSVMNMLIGSQGAKNGVNTPIPIDGEQSPLYEEVRRQLESSHQNIGSLEVQNINRLNQQFNLGSSNFSGFSWQKPFGVVQVYVDRQVTPNLFDKNWLIMDTFTFEVEATTFLERLVQAGSASMSATEIGAFAGVTFKRIYTNWHYADSYQEGLSSDFSKLFLPFIKFNKPSIEKMGNEEIMKREDTWTASAGGIISAPPIYNISFSGGVLTQEDYQNVTTVQRHQFEDYKYKIGILAKRTVNAGVSLELQLDFFKLLKLSLFRYDMNYEYASGKEFTLGFKADQWAHLKTDQEENAEFDLILKGFGAVKKLEPYVVRLDEASSSVVQQRGSILVWGKLQKQKTEQIRVIKDKYVRIFYKNYAQSIRVVQNIFSRIFSAVVYKLLKLPIGVNNAAVYSRQVTMEYEATHPQATDPKISRIEGSEQFSFILTQYYSAGRTDRWLDQKFKNDLIWFSDNFTTLPKSYKTDIRNLTLKGPMLIESHLRVEKTGFQFLLEAPENGVFFQIARICLSSKVEEWSQESSRRELLEENQTEKDACVKEIGQNYLSFRSDYLRNELRPSLARFKDFITKFFKKAGNISDLQTLFGKDNTFINGKLQATTSRGNPFNTTFSSGQFRGLGVIDNFKRSSGQGLPANIVSE